MSNGGLLHRDWVQQVQLCRHCQSWMQVISGIPSALSVALDCLDVYLGSACSIGTGTHSVHQTDDVGLLQAAGLTGQAVCGVHMSPWTLEPAPA